MTKDNTIKAKKKKKLNGRKASCQSGQQAVSYQSDKLKHHFQSGIKLSFSGCYEEGKWKGNSSQPVEVTISPPHDTKGSGKSVPLPIGNLKALQGLQDRDVILVIF
jgi:hypothetical protein